MHSALQRHGRRIVVAIFGLIVALGAYKTHENRTRRAAERQWHTQLQLLRAERATAYEDVQTWIHSLDTPDEARERLAAWAGDPAAVLTQSTGELLSVCCIHPVYAINVTQEFSRHSPQNPPLKTNVWYRQYQPPDHLVGASIADQIRQGLILPLSVLWLLAVARAFGSRKWGVISAWAAVLATLALGTSLAVDPLYDIDLEGILSNRASSAFAIMFPIAIGSLANHYVWRSGRSSPAPTVPPLRFSLRELLFVTAFLALLLGARPFGYLALATVVAGILLFWMLKSYLTMLRKGGRLMPPAAARRADHPSLPID